MYSLEQREAAVMLVLAEGLSPGRAIERLGYPRSTTAVREWVGEFLERGSLHRRKRGSKLYSLSELRPLEGGLANEGKEAELRARVAELEERVRELEFRRAVLEKAAELAGKELGADPANALTRRERAILVRDLTGPDMRQCDLLRAVGLPRSTYNSQLKAMEAPDKYAALRRAVAEAFAAGGGAYGYRRVKASLPPEHAGRSEKVVARIMAEEGLVAADSRARPRGWTSYEGETPGAPPNLVGRDFRAGLPNFLWLTDISEFSIKAGKLYLSVYVKNQLDTVACTD